MKKLILPLLLLSTAFYAQLTTIANYNFNASTAYPVLPSATASNVISSGSSSETFTVLPGTATGSGAFSINSTAGNALAIANSSGANTRYFLFQLSGADLSLYQAYKLYFQPQRSSAGANLITVAYSTNGSTYTNFASTYPVTTAFTDVVVDLSAVTALNNVSTVYIKLLLSGATATTGTLRIDNFEVQANKTGSGGGGGGGASGPWTVSGGNLNFTGNVGIGNSAPAVPLDVNGNTNINGNLTTMPTKNIVAGGSLIGNSNLAVAGTANLNGDVVVAPTKSLIVDGFIVCNGQLTVGGTTGLKGNVNVSTPTSTLTVASRANFNGDIVTATNKTLTVGGRANFNGDVATASGKTVTVGGNLIDNGSLTVVGTTSLNGDIVTATNRTLTVGGRANFNGDVATAAGKTVTVGGSLIDNGSLTVVGTTSLNGDVFTASNKTLTVGGRANFNGDVATAAGKTVTVGGSLIDNGSLTVVGTTSLNGDVFTATNKTLTVAGRANFNGDVATAAGKTVTVGGSLIDNGSLTVVGTTSLNGDVFTAANKTLTVAGRANFNGDVATAAGKTVTVGGSLIDNGSLTVVGTTSLNGNIFTAANKTLTVGGTAKFNNNVNIGGKLLFGNSGSKFGIGFTPAVTNGPSVFKIGVDSLLNGINTPVTWSPCTPFGAIPPVVTTFGGLIQTYNVNASNNYVAGTTIFDIGANASTAYLNSKFAPLSINGDCGSNIYLLGVRVGFGTAAPTEKFHFTNGNVLIDGNASSGNNYRVKIDGGVQPGLQITTTNVDAFDIIDPNTNISNFRVKLNGIAYAREVVVTLNPFPDYVFANNYKLPKLSEVKDYISKNHRLINMPSASEIKENGANLGEVQRVTVEKLEEAYLYILQLEEKIERLNKKFEELESKK